MIAVKVRETLNPLCYFSCFTVENNLLQLLNASTLNPSSGKKKNNTIHGNIYFFRGLYMVIKQVRTWPWPEGSLGPPNSVKHDRLSGHRVRYAARHLGLQTRGPAQQHSGPGRRSFFLSFYKLEADIVS